MTGVLVGMLKMAGNCALLIAALLAFGVVRGRAWTQAHLAGTAAVLYLISRLD